MNRKMFPLSLFSRRGLFGEWVLASTVGMAVVIYFFVATPGGALIGRFPLFAGALSGLLLGLFQGSVVRPRLGMGWMWPIATMTGVAAAWVLAAALDGHGPFDQTSVLFFSLWFPAIPQGMLLGGWRRMGTWVLCGLVAMVVSGFAVIGLPVITYRAMHSLPAPWFLLIIAVPALLHALTTGSMLRSVIPQVAPRG